MKFFTKIHKNDFISQTKSGQPYSEEIIKTYKIQKTKNKFELFEMNRKEKPKKVRTINITKKRKNVDDAIRDVREERLKLKSQYQTEYYYKGKTNYISQQNYKPSTKNYQLVGIVRADDHKRDIHTSYFCYSRSLRFNSETKTYISYDDALNDLIRTAKWKFAQDFGKYKYNDVEFTIETVRYQRFHKKRQRQETIQRPSRAERNSKKQKHIRSRHRNRKRK